MGVYPHSSPSSASGRTRKACRASPTETSSVNSTQFPISAPNPFLGDGWGLAPPARFCEHPQQAELRVRGGCLYPPPQPAAPLRGGSGLAVRGRPGRWRWVPACSRSARGPLPAETAAARSVGGTGTGPFSQPSWSSPGSTLGLGAFTPPQSVNISGFLVFFFFSFADKTLMNTGWGVGTANAGKCKYLPSPVAKYLLNILVENTMYTSQRGCVKNSAWEKRIGVREMQTGTVSV